MSTPWRWTCGVLAVLIAMLPTMAGPAGAETTAKRTAQQMAADFSDRLGVPGVAIAVMDSGRVVESGTVGRDGRGEPITTSTPFVWGSVSKSVTATIVSRLAARGALRVDQSVESVLPEARLPRDVTIDDLVHLTSGLGHDLTRTDDWSRRGSAADAVRSSPPPQTSSRGTFRYSSLNYLLLQAVLERVSGRTFRDVVTDEVARPAGADGMVADGTAFRATVPPGHVPFFTAARSTPIGVDEAGFGYGYLAGSIADLGAYASWQLRQARSTDTAAVLRRDDLVPTGSVLRYGYGWYVETMRDATGTDREVRWHSGAVPGYFTHIALIPATDRAVVVLANRYGELESTESASAARAVVRGQLGGRSAIGPGGLTLYRGVLLGAVLVASALVVVTARSGTRLWRGGASRSRTGLVLRATIVTAVAAAALAALLLGVPAVAGAPLSVIPRWAPDVGLLVWVLVGEVIVAAMVTFMTVARNGRSVGSLPEHARTVP